MTSETASSYLLISDRVFDGHESHEGWAVEVRGERIERAGPVAEIRNASTAAVVEVPGTTLLPGLIEAHSHVLLHPYSETSWNDQVAREALSLRTARATNHLRDTLFAGFTTIRDLGTEGAGYADIGLRQAIEQGIIPGPRMLVATRAIVTTGSYGPKGYAPEWEVPIGAEEADGVESLIRAVRGQIGKGADWVKLYADYRWGRPVSMPTFSLEELTLAVETAHSAGIPVAAHANTTEGMRRAALAGVDTIEHGDGGTATIFQLMKDRGIAYCPTLSVASGERAEHKARVLKLALEVGVTIAAGSDVGVYPHGDNVRELEKMVAAGMLSASVLTAATAGNADVLQLDGQIGAIKPGMIADLIAVEGDPTRDISSLRSVRLVMKGGAVVHGPTATTH